MGVDIARAARASGHGVVATARSAASLVDVLGEDDDLLELSLDVTDPDAAQASCITAPQNGGGDQESNQGVAAHHE